MTSVDGNNDLNSVSCPSSGHCVAVDFTGNAVTSTDPTTGASGWTVPHIDGTVEGSLNGVSYPSSSLCVAVDQGGNVLTGTGAATTTLTSVAFTDNAHCVRRLRHCRGQHEHWEGGLNDQL